MRELCHSYSHSYFKLAVLHMHPSSCRGFPLGASTPGCESLYRCLPGLVLSHVRWVQVRSEVCQKKHPVVSRWWWPVGTRWRWRGHLVYFSISLLLYFPQVSVCLLNEVSSAANFLPLSWHGFLVPSCAWNRRRKLNWNVKLQCSYFKSNTIHMLIQHNV